MCYIDVPCSETEISSNCYGAWISHSLCVRTPEEPRTAKLFKNPRFSTEPTRLLLSCTGEVFLSRPLSVRFQVPLAMANKKNAFAFFLAIATGLGIEPRLKASKASVLPLDDPVILYLKTIQYLRRAGRRPASFLPVND